MGMEVHVELHTATKMFCRCPTAFGAEPNTQVCPVCLGLPGSMPVVNASAVESAIRIGLALNCSITPWGRFARKNYFYPDQPKNYQISQYDEPIATDGYLDVVLDDGTTWRVEIERAHMEEDTGKSLHVGGATGRIHGASHSLLDYNRAGVPLVEIVTKTISGAGERAPEVARAYVTALRDLLKSLDVSDVRMDQGSMRCDANISLMPIGATELGTRTETKNVNSLKSVEVAVRYEMRRQAAVLSAGGEVIQETRHFQEADGTTSAGRRKETAEDYRYFPEPDLEPVAPSAEWVEELRGTLPELPWIRRARIQADWGLRRGDARPGELRRARPGHRDHRGRRARRRGAVLVGGVPLAAGEHPWRRAGRAADHPGAAGAGHRARRRRHARRTSRPARPSTTCSPARASRTRSSPSGRTGRHARRLRAQAAVDAALAANPDIAEKIRSGKVAAAGKIVGDVMKATRGQADPAQVKDMVIAACS